MQLETILCEFGQICATGNPVTVGRNSILNFPAKICTGMCSALLCGMHIFLGSRSEQGGTRRAPKKRINDNMKSEGIDISR